MRKKILFITPYPPGEAPSQRFRFEQYLSLLNEHGVEVATRSFLSTKSWNRLYLSGYLFYKFSIILNGFLKRIISLFTIYKYDDVFIHREVTPIGPPIFEWIIAKIFRKKIIYDFDDAIWLEDPDEKGSLLGIIKWKSKAASVCKWSYKISCGNEYLADYARKYNKNVVVNPTTIDTENLHNSKLYDGAVVKHKLTIGWTGTHSTMQYLTSIIPIIKLLEKKYEFEFLVISNRPPKLELQSLRYLQWNKKSEISDLMNIDIGIMPLSKDEWSEGKCGFKILQYMSLEIPALASPVGVNSSIIEHTKNGFICENYEDWLHYLELLLTNKSKRVELGKNGRKYVVNNYSVKSNSTNFLSLFE